MVFANWLGIAPKYYSNWKHANKFMNSVSARKCEAKLQIEPYSLDVLHIKDDILTIYFCQHHVIDFKTFLFS